MPTRALHHRLSLGAALILVGILGAGGCSSQPNSAAPVKKGYSFWPAAPDLPHVQFLVSYNFSEDIAQSRGKFDEILYGKTAGLPIKKPYGLAMWNGRIYLADPPNRGVIVLDLVQHQTRVMGVTGAADLKEARAVAVGPDGSKYVVDSAHNAIIAFDPDERYRKTITLPDFNPVGVAVYKNELYVSDFAAGVVKVLDASSGKFLRTVGKPGPSDGEFIHPLGIWVDNDGNVFVADVFKSRIQKFSRDGKLLLAFGQAGTRPGDFIRPKHMSVDSNGMIYVVDASFNNVQVFDPMGKVVGFFGSQGTHSGAMDLPAGLFVSESPSDLEMFQKYVHPAFEAKRLIMVSNQFGPNKVAVYAEGQIKPGKTLADITGRTDVSVGLETTAPPTSRPITIGTPLPPEFLTPSTTTSPATAPAGAGQ